MRRALAIFAAVSFACGNSEPSGTSDASGSDAGAADGEANDSGSPDDAGHIDGGPRDAGFSDPATVLQGTHSIEGLITYVHMMGTFTSTLPAIILLPTGPDLSHEYLPNQMRFLLPGRLLVYYDLRASGRTSFGTTSMTATLTVDRHVLDLHDLVAFVDTFTPNAPEKVDLLGHGYGAGVAALYTAAHPEKVAHLVVTAPYPADANQLALYNAEAPSRLTSTERALINELELEPECRGDESRCTIEIWNILGPHYLCEENEGLFRSLTFEYGSPRARDFIEFGLRENRYDWRPIFATIAVPTTVISGPCDPIPAAAAVTYTSSISGSVHHVMSQSGHFPMLEQRDEYQRRVLEALRR